MSEQRESSSWCQGGVPMEAKSRGARCWEATWGGEELEPAEQREGRPGGRRSLRCGVKGRESVPRTDDGAQAEAKAWRGAAAPARVAAPHGQPWQHGARRVGGDARLEWAGGGTKGLQTPLPGAQKRGSGWRGARARSPLLTCSRWRPGVRGSDAGRPGTGGKADREQLC